MNFRKGEEPKRKVKLGKNTPVKCVGYGKYADTPFYKLVKNDPQYFKQIKKLYYDKYDFATKHYYDALVKKYFKDFDLYQDKKDEIISIFIHNAKTDRLKTAVLKEQLKEKYPGVAPALLNECELAAPKIIQQQYDHERDYLVDIHCLRYEDLYQKTLDVDLTKVPPEFRNSVLAESYVNAMETLIQKEKLLGYHHKTFKIQISNYLQQKKQKQSKKVNLDALSLNEQIELLSLINKAKSENIVQQSIVSSITVEPVVRKQDRLLIEAPIKESQETDVYAEDEIKQVKSQGKSLIDIQLTMKENVKKQLEEALKNMKKK